MSKRSQRGRPRRKRVGRVSYYEHHNSWWIYYRQGGRQVRRKVGDSAEAAERIASEINGQLASCRPTQFDFVPIGIVELRQRFLTYHEDILGSSIATVKRYRAATQHLIDFISSKHHCSAHDVDAAAFASYLRSISVAPNGHVNTPKRKLRGKGIQYILQTCRSLFNFAKRNRHLPPYVENPFADLRLESMRIVDSKEVHIFDAESEKRFFGAADAWSFPIHFVLAKTGLRAGELTHLLIEDLDLDQGWLAVRNKAELGWTIKTGRERKVPLAPAVVRVLRNVIGTRIDGLVFRRPKYSLSSSLAGANRQRMAKAVTLRTTLVHDNNGGSNSRLAAQKAAASVWREAGHIRSESIRASFVRINQQIGLPQMTCPKSWRHTFATLLQDAGVDPLIRQIVMGHKPTYGSNSELGMTAVYTHSRAETIHREIIRAIELWPNSLTIAQSRTEVME